MFVLNTTIVGDREYNEYDITRLYPIDYYGLEPGFYGGRVNWVSPVKDSDVLLLIQYKDGAHQVLDTAVLSLDKVPIKLVREIAKRRKLEFTFQTPREELIKLIENA